MKKKIGITSQDIARGKLKRKYTSQESRRKDQQAADEAVKLLTEVKDGIDEAKIQAQELNKIANEHAELIQDSKKCIQTQKLMSIMVNRLVNLLQTGITGLEKNKTDFKTIRDILIDTCWPYFESPNFDDNVVVQDLRIALSKKFRYIFEEKNFWYQMGANVWNFVRKIWSSQYIFLSPMLKEAYLDPSKKQELQRFASEAFDEVFKKHNLEKPDTSVPLPKEEDFQQSKKPSQKPSVKDSAGSKAEHALMPNISKNKTTQMQYTHQHYSLVARFGDKDDQAKSPNQEASDSEEREMGDGFFSEENNFRSFFR